MTDSTLRTTLHSRHAALGANMVPFGGWDMPLWYKSGAVKEHMAVIQAAGLFDTGHMDVVVVSGPAARKFLNFAFTRDIGDLRVGRCGYGAFLADNGNCLDDAIVYPLDDERFGVVVNASMAAPILRHLSTLPGADGAVVQALSPRAAKLDVQGPASVRILARVLADADATFESFPYFSFKGDFDFGRSSVRLQDGTPVLLSRTGYTGEAGFELFLPEEAAGAVWDRLRTEGEGEGLLPCGLAARDSLRTGAVLPLSHQDIGSWPFINHPWPFALPLAPDGTFTKEFFGREALKPEYAPYTLPFVGFDPRRVDSHDAAVLVSGRNVGVVSTIVSDMAIGRIDGAVVGAASPGRPEGWSPRGLACGFVRVTDNIPPGTEVVLKDGRREIKAEIVRDIRPDRTARKKLSTFLP